MACTDNYCLSTMGGISLAFIPLPDFPPPPPLPSFMAPLVVKDNLTESCDLCSKWGDNSLLASGADSNNLTFMLAMVAIISALFGAAIMAAILSIKRLRKRRSLNPDSMRHLERKCNEHNQTLPQPPSRSTNSTPLSNTYCEGPYNDNNKESFHCNNIYAELQSSASDIWRRPPIPVPKPTASVMMMDSCYLELRDLPRVGVGLPLPCVTTPLFTPQAGSQPQSPGTYSLSPSNSTTTASYYTDLELKNCREIR